MFPGREITMFYTVLKYLARLALKVYFRNVYMTGVENIPADKPVLLACNHPSAFMEACLLAVFLKRPLYFLTRGDMFKGAFMKSLLFATNQIPIYRFRDGFEQLRENHKTFQKCYDKLDEGRMILIFSEAGTSLEKRLRPIQKGTAKLALGAMEQNLELDLEIVPVSVNYQDPRVVGSEVYFAFGEAIPVREVLAAEGGDSRRTIRKITAELQEKIGGKVVEIPDPSRDTITEQVQDLFREGRKGSTFPFLRFNQNPLLEEIQVAQAVAGLSGDEFHELEQANVKYQANLTRFGIADDVLVRINSYGIAEYLLLLPASAIYLFGYLLNLLPVVGFNKLVRPKVKSQPFMAPMKWAIGFVLSTLEYLILLLILTLVWGLAGFIFWLFCIMSSYFAVKQENWIKTGWASLKMHLLHRNKLPELRNLRRELLLRVSNEIQQSEKSHI